MRTLTVDLPERAYDIVIKNGLLSEVGKRIKTLLPKAVKLAVVTDTTVFSLYAQAFAKMLEKEGFIVKTIAIPAGESSKSIRQLENLYNTFAEFGLTRTDAVVAVGGGVVGDLAGFAAATVFRGIAYFQVPTTLLAQIDSSVGGKTAVNLASGKNLVGAFWQPKAVFIDPLCLESLPDVTFADGMAEVIKYGCIGNGEFFNFLKQSDNRAGVMANIEQVVYTCCKIKAEIVAQDEKDTGLRMILNFGHTLGHAYELAGGYEKYTHGQAVAAGMCVAARLSEKMGICDKNLMGEVSGLIRRFGLPEKIECEPVFFEKAISLDKKGEGGEINLILLSQIGKAEIVKVQKAALMRALTE